MRTLRGLQPFFCVLLAVSTAIGTLPAVGRACGCSLPSATRSTNARLATQQTCSTVAPTQSCCPASEPGSCCSSSGSPKKACCAKDRGKPREANGPRPWPCGTHSSKPEPTGCPCAVCECDRPVEPSAPVPASTASKSLILAASPPPPVLLTTTPVPRTLAGSQCVPPPTDLVISLSRLTC